MRIFRLLALFALLTASAFPQSQSEQGPFCWAGTDRNGEDIFILCEPKHSRIIHVHLDQDIFDAVKIHTKEGSITVSREKFLGALAAWRAENRAKP